MRMNIFKRKRYLAPRTHEGAPAAILTPEQALRRSVLSCMLWENEFYEDGVQIAGRIHQLVPQVAAEQVAALAPPRAASAGSRNGAPRHPSCSRGPDADPRHPACRRAL